jgi:ribosomal protein S27AE
MPRRHKSYRGDEILHDFDADARILRICFVSPAGKLFGVTYRLCPVCGVTMDEHVQGAASVWYCGVCGFTISDASSTEAS